MRGGPPPGGGSVNEGTGSHVTGEYNGGITMPYFKQKIYFFHPPNYEKRRFPWQVHLTST